MVSQALLRIRYKLLALKGKQTSLKNRARVDEILADLDNVKEIVEATEQGAEEKQSTNTMGSVLN